MFLSRSAIALIGIPLLLQAGVGHGYPGPGIDSRSEELGQSLLYPVSVALSTQPSTAGHSITRFQLNASFPVATLDYGYEVAGFPFFDVKSVSGTVQIEVKYAEEFAALNSNFSDGPFPYAVSLANTYRVETYEIDCAGTTQAFLLQGGQRWQSIRLLTGDSIAFSSAGIVPTTPVMDIEDLPGSFTSDDDDLNDIWKLGARAASVACVEEESQTTMWEVDATNGTFVRGMRAGITTKGAFFSDYTLEFDAYIETGGIGWVVAFPLASPVEGIQLNLVANKQSFVNTNTTLTVPNSILFGYGYSLVNVTTLTSYYLDTFTVPFTVQERTWYRVKTILDGEHLAVSIGVVQVFNLTLADYYIGSSYITNGKIPSSGSFGFGGWQDQAGYFKNVTVYDTANGTELYSNPMTDSSSTGVTLEYGVQANSASVCLDGPKRDRLVWLGDFLHTSRIIAASTSRFDIAKSTLEYVLSYQTSTGLLPYDPPIGYVADLASEAFELGGGGLLEGSDVYTILLADYQILGLLSFASYIRTSNDLDFASESWTQWQLLVEWLIDSISSATRLLDLYGAFLGPSTGGSAVSCALVQALNEMADVATAIGDNSTASSYRATASTLASAINSQLWNENLGVYSLSPSDPDDYSVNSIAFCITSGTANATQAAQLISALPTLRLSPGYKDSTLVSSTDTTAMISPNTNGFLLEALLSQQTASAATTSKALLQSLWMAMLANDNTTTGASWEYVSQTGDPGYGPYTSLSHPWGGAPTYLLTEWAAGIQTADGVDGFGYRNWVIRPYMGIEMGLKNVTAKVVTAFDGTLEVSWLVNDAATSVDVTVKAPVMTSGRLELGATNKILAGSEEYRFSVAL
ncbi:glycoside hydrolase family 78 protein [Diplogelasinospora grovesii]|uniref:Glycoside hydrolase family 78 protein n=1 Tax=Diplogelasinospora grovesii TaxID=303347 RepID=A0AAN6S5C8_9PEZI|nr:glycoside hydrolase family 78 protein [Diplogelasinospora grovesii]